MKQIFGFHKQGRFLVSIQFRNDLRRQSLLKTEWTLSDCIRRPNADYGVVLEWDKR